MSRTQKSTLNFGTSLLYTGVTLALGIFTTPLLLRWLGEERFGTFRVLQDWWAYSTIFEYGLGGALVARLAMVVSRNDARATRRLIATGLRMYVRVTLALLAMGLLWIAFLPGLITVKNISTTELRMGGFVLLLAGLLLPLTVFRCLAEAKQRSYVVNLLLTMQSLLMTGLLLLAAWLGGGLIGQSLATTLVLVLLPTYLIYEARQQYPGILNEAVDQETAQDLQTLNGPTLLFNLSGRISLFTDNIVIAWGLGAWAVAPFFLTQRLANIALTQFQAIGNATWAGLVELHMQGESDVFRQRLLELTSFVSSVGIVVLVPLAAYNRYFVARWVGPENFAGEKVTLLSCFNIWLWGIIALWGWPITGTGNIGKWVPYAFVAMLINVIVSIVGVLQLGFIGPLLGTTIGFVGIYSWSMPLVIKQVFQVRQADLWKSATAPLLWGIPYAILVWSLAHRLPPQNWFELLFWMATTALLGAASWWALGINRELRHLWVMRLRLALGK